MAVTTAQTNKKISMVSIQRATEKDYQAIIQIGRYSVQEAHKESCSPEILNEYIEENYNEDSITKELRDKTNLYHLIHYKGQPAGFSKIIMNESHSAIQQKNVAKLDRIYLDRPFHGKKLGVELLKHNIELSKSLQQAGIWLYTWVGNKKAIDFYTRAGFRSIGKYDFHIARSHYNPNYHMFLDFL